MPSNSLASIIQYSFAALGVIVAVFIIVMVIIKIKLWIRGIRLEGEGVNRKIISERWQEIEKLTAGGGEMSYKLAVMEADKLLDYTLKAMVIPGNTLGERLKFACYKYDKLHKVWWAHKIRNQLVHESSFRLNKNMARKAIHAFKKALEELGAL